MIESVCRYCACTLRDGRNPFSHWCPSSLAGERFVCESRTQGDRIVDDLAQRTRRRAIFGGAKKSR